jgi:hypothetical protein
MAIVLILPCQSRENLPRWWPEDNERIPLLQGKIKEKPLILASAAEIWPSKLLILFGFEADFRYSVEQRNLPGLTGEINVRAAELQRKPLIDPRSARRDARTWLATTAMLSGRRNH